MDRYNKGGALPLYQATGPARRSPNIGLGLSQQFQISGYMMFASLCFWIFLFFAAYKGVQYGRLYMTFDDESLEAVGCCGNFGGTFLENLNFLENYPKLEAGPYLMRLGPETYTSEFKGTQSPKELPNIPTIVTAVSTADFYPVQSLIKQWNEVIKPFYKDAKFIIYNIGLYSKELELIQAHCGCEVREFRTSAYPNHVADITTFAYRPVIIQTILEESGSVMWINPDMLFTQASDLKQLMYRGARDFFLWQPEHFIGTVAFTDMQMFDFLKEPRCCFTEASMVDISTMVFYRTNITWTAIMKPWLKCALNSACIAPPKARYSGCFEMRSPKTTGCHRYDQSALSIILDRGFQFSTKAEKFVTPRVTRRQDEYLEYFPEQPWTYTELFFVSAVPLTCIGGLIFLFWRRKRSTKKSNYSKR